MSQLTKGITLTSSYLSPVLQANRKKIVEEIITLAKELRIFVKVQLHNLPDEELIRLHNKFLTEKKKTEMYQSHYSSVENANDITDTSVSSSTTLAEKKRLKRLRRRQRIKQSKNDIEPVNSGDSSAAETSVKPVRTIYMQKDQFYMKNHSGFSSEEGSLSDDTKDLMAQFAVARINDKADVFQRAMKMTDGSPMIEHQLRNFLGYHKPRYLANSSSESSDSSVNYKGIKKTFNPSASSSSGNTTSSIGSVMTSDTDFEEKAKGLGITKKRGSKGKRKEIVYTKFFTLSRPLQVPYHLEKRIVSLLSDLEKKYYDDVVLLLNRMGTLDWKKLDILHLCDMVNKFLEIRGVDVDLQGELSEELKANSYK